MCNTGFSPESTVHVWASCLSLMLHTSLSQINAVQAAVVDGMWCLWLTDQDVFKREERGHMHLFMLCYLFFIGKAFKLNIKHIRVLFRAFKSVWGETEKNICCGCCSQLVSGFITFPLIFLKVQHLPCCQRRGLAWSADDFHTFPHLADRSRKWGWLSTFLF